MKMLTATDGFVLLTHNWLLKTDFKKGGQQVKSEGTLHKEKSPFMSR